MSDEEENIPSQPQIPSGSPFVYFTTKGGRVHAIYRSVLSNSKVDCQ